MNDAQLDALRRTLATEMERQREAHFGDIGAKWVTYAEGSFWDATKQAFRADDLRRYGFSPKAKVLDLAAGCGQFVQYGSMAGYDMWGVEPEKWKLELIKRKFEYLGLSAQREQVREGVGEALPFSDCTFDCVTSYQTLEHVQDPLKVLREMVRVTKAGGGIYIRCPDYRSTYEAHYRLPWLPLFPRRLAKQYLRLMARPVAGLDTIQYVTKPRILKMLSALELDGIRLMVFDDSRVQFENALRRRGIPFGPMAFELNECLKWFRGVFRRELNVNLFVRITGK